MYECISDIVVAYKSISYIQTQMDTSLSKQANGVIFSNSDNK